MIKSIVFACVAATALAFAAIGGATALAKKKHHHVSAEKVQADPNGALKFNTRKLSAKAGVVSITMVNPKTSDTDHGIAISGKGVSKDGKIVHPGKSSKVAVTLKRGTYTFFCPVPGHEAAGMKGRLVVK